MEDLGNNGKKVRDEEDITPLDPAAGIARTREVLREFTTKNESVEIPTDIKKVIDEFEDGEIWNALARLRQVIESKLRQIGRKQGYKISHLRSAGQILHILGSREIIDPQLEGPLCFAISVCNRAIHGNDVPVEEANTAIMVAANVLDRLPFSSSVEEVQ